MANGYKTGGRLAGTPNADRKTLLEMLQEKYPEYNPVLAMADIANDMTNDLQIRFQACKEVAKYLCPQVKAIEANSLDNDTVIHVTFHDEVITTSPDEYKSNQSNFR